MGRVLLLLTLLLTLASPAGAEDYYCVSTTGVKTTGVSTTDIDGFGWANADCYGTIQAALAQAGGGDQVWVNDGSYTGDITVGSGLAGSSGDYTIVTARNPGEVDLGANTFRVDDTSYVEVIGFSIADPGEEQYSYEINHSDHIKMKRCVHTARVAWTGNGSSYVLWEDCFAYGGPFRYTYQTPQAGGFGGNHHVVYRRCLVRWDWGCYQEPQVQGCFSSYTADNVHYQNCVVVDTMDNNCYDHYAEDGLKAFVCPNGSTNNSYTGCMAIAQVGASGWVFEGDNVSAAMQDCVVWNIKSTPRDTVETAKPVALQQQDDVTAGLTINQCTFGSVEWGGGPGPILDWHASGTIGESMRNCILYDLNPMSGQFAVGPDLNDYDYNLYYQITGNRYIEDGLGPNDITGVDPRANGLFYVTQVEPCSYLQTAGENGGQIGAQIKTKIGVDGTLYGDPGWNEDTGVPLWPFPYEDQIREKCGAFYLAAGAAYTDSPEMIGARGFCSGSWTLSSYLRAGGE